MTTANTVLSILLLAFLLLAMVEVAVNTYYVYALLKRLKVFEYDIKSVQQASVSMKASLAQHAVELRRITGTSQALLNEVQLSRKVNDGLRNEMRPLMAVMGNLLVRMQGTMGGKEPK